MEETPYGLRVTVSLPYEQALDRATEALRAEGFGVLTTIDVKQTPKQKLDREFRKYVSSAPATRRSQVEHCVPSWRSVFFCRVM